MRLCKAYRGFIVQPVNYRHSSVNRVTRFMTEGKIELYFGEDTPGSRIVFTRVNKILTIWLRYGKPYGVLEAGRLQVMRLFTMLVRYIKKSSLMVLSKIILIPSPPLTGSTEKFSTSNSPVLFLPHKF